MDKVNTKVIVDQKNQEILDHQQRRIINFLRVKGILKGDATIWQITFDDGESLNIVDLFQEMMNMDENYPLGDVLRKVEQFHDVYEIPIEEVPTIIDVKEGAIRLALLYEEARETQDATRDEDIVEIFDGLGDQLYILAGTVLKYGMQDIIVKGFKAIHDSNMTKLSADGSPIYRKSDGKVMKGPFYQKPTDDLTNILRLPFQKANDARRDND